MNSYNERLDKILMGVWHKGYNRCNQEKNHSDGYDNYSYSMNENQAKQAITSLIKELVAEARIDELSQLLDEGEGGYPDGCEAVHLHSIEDRIAQLTQSNKEATQ